MSEIRYCKLTQQEVIIAPNRLSRPGGLNSYQKLEQESAHCPFEKGNEAYTPQEICRISDKEGNWLCRVVPNLYKVLSLEEADGSFKEEFYEKRGGFGVHEVIIETPLHELQMFDFSSEQLHTYLLIVQKRYIELEKDKRLHYLSIFKNSGKNAGASLYHSHSQIIAMPTLPQAIENALTEQKRYFDIHSRALLDDLVYEEQYIQKRVLSQNNSFIAYCPYASSFAFEVIIANTLKVASIKECSDEQLKDLALIMQKVFGYYKDALGAFDFNMIFYNTPLNAKTDVKQSHRFYIRIIPRLYNVAGFELVSGMTINPMPPEEAVKLLKKES